MATPDYPTRVFKILTSEQWADWQAKGDFGGASIDLTDGYIHLSTLDQAVETHGKFFAGQKDLALILVDLEKVSDPIKWEPSRNGELFPHVYGTINLKAIVGKIEGWAGDKPDIENMMSVGKNELPKVDTKANSIQ